jgi:hypothetical protein
MGFQLNELCKENRAVWRRPLMMYAELFSLNHFEMESSSLLSCIYWRNKSFPFFLFSSHSCIYICLLKDLAMES